MKYTKYHRVRKCKKNLRGQGAPSGRGTDPPIFYSPMTSIFSDSCEKWSKIAFWSKKIMGEGYPLLLPSK